jgi:hypothetical protein
MLWDDVRVLTARGAAAPLLDENCPLPPTLEMSVSARACQRTGDEAEFDIKIHFFLNY